MFQRFLVSAILVMVVASTAFAGGADGVGGDILQSSKSQVRRAVDEAMKFKLAGLFYNLAFLRAQVKDPYVFRVLNAFYDHPLKGDDWESRQPILKDLQATTYWFNEDGGCAGANHEAHHAASVPEYKLGAPICFSVPVLRGASPEDLPDQVTALAAHEFAHHFGFGEYEAVLFQTFILHHAKKLIDFQDRFVLNLKEIKPMPTVKRPGDQEAVVFQSGKILDQMPPEGQLEPVCVIWIRHEFDEIQEAKKLGRFPELYLSERSIELMVVNSSAGFGHGYKKAGLTGVWFDVNPVMGNFSYEPTGASLRRIDGKNTNSKFLKFSCQGQGLQMMDLKRAMGPYLETPKIIK